MSHISRIIQQCRNMWETGAEIATRQKNIYIYLPNNPHAERAARRPPQPHVNSRPTVRKQDSCLSCRWSPHKYSAEATATNSLTWIGCTAKK